MPSAGDAYIMATDPIPSGIRIQTAGPNKRWDFTTLIAPYARQYSWRDASGAKIPGIEYLTAPTEAFTEAFFHKTASELRIGRARGQDPLGVSHNSLIVYSPALTLRKFPLRYGDQGTYRTTMTITCAAGDASPLVLRKLPFQPDSLRFRVNVERLTEVDAWGRLIIPGGIYDVLRERQTESWDIQIDVRIGKRKWQHISSMLDIPIIFPHTEILSYAFYNNSFPEPIATATMDASSENTVARMEFKVFDTEETPLLTSLSPNIFVYPNPAIVNARFEFFNLPTGEYELSIFDPIGRPILMKRYYVSGNRTERIDVSEFRKGGYLYTLKDNKGNTIATKRFIVIRP
jgi:hypothetical protein